MTPSSASAADSPKRSWRNSLKRALAEIRADNLTDWAAALTYYSVLSLFPALIVIVSIVGLFGDPVATTRALVEVIREIGPTAANDSFRGPVESLTDNRGAAGALLAIGVLIALWTASGYVGAFTRAANAVYDVEEDRPFWKLRPLQLGITLLVLVLLALVATALVVSGPVARAVGEVVGLGDTAVAVWDLAKWPFLVAVVLTVFAVLYRACPNVDRGRGLAWITQGSVLAVALWIAASALFGFYVANFGSYDRTYGTLGGVITFLVWLWMSNLAILLGLERNAKRESESSA